MNISSEADNQIDITELLKLWTEGDQEALARLTAVLYDELRRIARLHMQKERGDHTLQPTALVNESFLRLVRQKDIKWQSRVHFLAVASQVMRHILVDYARHRTADKRGGSNYKIPLDQVNVATNESMIDLVALDEALTGLAKLNPTHGRIVELHYFGGLSIDETAMVLGIAPRTVSHGWLLAKTWLYKELKKR
ncbi:MAG: sigma-70 family RNA polymerase sigma factor [Acidobacteriota bacterium]